MISGLVLKYLNGECFVICGFYKYTLLASTEFNLTVPLTPLGESSGTGAVRRMRIGIGLLAQSDEATQGDLTQSTIQ
jgi:hypothetical protein